MERLLRPDGICLFTIPSYEWAKRFRDPKAVERAEFLLRDGTIAVVPSFIPPVEEQLTMIRDANLVVCEIAELFREDLKHSVSPKLNVFDTDQRCPILRGFKIQKTIKAYR